MKDRRTELADAAVETLGELGYARTSLREIAARSGLSLGPLHYHFTDKTALIAFCVQRYKAIFIREMDAILDGRHDAATLPVLFAAGLAKSIRQHAHVHRLWYDIRAQAMFDRAFTDVVEEIETALIAMTAHFCERAALPREMALTLYLTLDGHYRYATQRFLGGEKEAPRAFERQAMGLLQGLCPCTPPEAEPLDSLDLGSGV